MPFLAAALPSLIAGAFSAFGPNAGAQRKQLKYQNQVMQNQLGIMKQLRQYGNSPVGSDPLEAANFANQRAQLGQQQNQQRMDMTAQYNRNQGTNGLGDFMNNLNSNQTAQQMSLNAQNNLAAMQNRRSALLQSAQVGQAVPNYQPPANGLPELFGSLAQTWAHQQEVSKQDRQQQAYLKALQANAGMNQPQGPYGMTGPTGGMAGGMPGITPGLMPGGNYNYRDPSGVPGQMQTGIGLGGQKLYGPDYGGYQAGF